MSLLVSAVTSFGPNIVLLAVFVYQLFWPTWMHPTGGTRLQKLLHEPNPAVVATLIRLAETDSQTDDEQVKDWFNGGDPKPRDLRVDPSELRKGD